MSVKRKVDGAGGKLGHGFRIARSPPLANPGSDDATRQALEDRYGKVMESSRGDRRRVAQVVSMSSAASLHCLSD